MKSIAAVLVCALAGVVPNASRGEQVALDSATGLPAARMPVIAARPAVAPFWARRITGYLLTDDGHRLRYSVLLPRGSGRAPVVLSINGYDAGSIGGAAYLQGRTSMSLDLDRRLVEAGYAVMGLNAAGTGCSEGPLEYTRPQLGRHGAQAVEFAAAQPWSDGKVGMVGSSYGGSAQLAVAQQRPAHLRAIAPGMPLTDYRDALMPGGVPQPGFITPFRVGFRAWWSEVVAQTAKEEGDARCLQQVARNLAGEDENSVMHLFLAHPLRDAHMDSFDLARDAGRIAVPVLALEAFQDQAITPRSSHYQSRLRSELLWQVQSNGRHDLYFATAFHSTLLRFLDRFVKGQDNGFERETARTTVWMEAHDDGGDGFARRVSAQPLWVVRREAIGPEDLRPIEFHLTPGKALSGSMVAGPADAFDYPGTGIAVNDLAGNTNWGPLPADWAATSLAFTSAPLASDMMVYGPGSADLWVAATAGDADLQVTLTEVRSDGQEMYVQRGWLRLSNRALDEARSTPLLPIHVEQAERPMPLLPGRPVLARVEIQKMGHYFRKGSRLRIWIDRPAQTGGLVFDPFTQRQRIHLLHTARHDSLVRLGVLDGVQGPPAYPECGKVMLQPCRPDPLALAE